MIKLEPVRKFHRNKKWIRRNMSMLIATLALFFFGLSFLWVASLRIPALEDIAVRRLSQSTKIYDRTGEVLLYDVSQDVKRALIAFEDISPYVKEATLAIEDKEFYSHSGFKFSSFMRALLTNISTLSFSQGGSTITQQVVKNSILTKDKTPTRKLKELILALKLDRALSKDEILNFYLNEIPYGGNVYGVEEAARTFYGKSAKDLTLAEASYLAALPKAPTFYSPYGRNREKLEERKNLTLSEMLSLGFITEEEYNKALDEEVTFKPRENNSSIKAPHFVFFVTDYLAQKYGEDAVANGGFRVITSLDYEIQRDAEAIAKKYGTINADKFDGENNAIVVLDPKTGEILAMVGSRDYFDDTIDGNFNVAIAHRQPGSAFKPIVYATLFDKGYTPETILFDVETQFSAVCAADNSQSTGNCYSPGNYDNKYRGPISIRNALAQSVNIPAVKALYLAGLRDAIGTAKDMGIEGLTDPDRYGLTLVLGGGEVSLLDMTVAYSVFANNGLRTSYSPILRVENTDGEIIERHTPFSKRVLSEQAARNISSILSDNVARVPLYGSNSPLFFGGRDVAAKTGTTNDSKDAWILGYTPNLVVGAWVGNNDNTPMDRSVAGLIVSPLWRELMDKTLPKFPSESFVDPTPVDQTIKPILRGEWRGGGSSSPVMDAWGQITGHNVAANVHSILYWVDRSNPTGPSPSNPARDPQFNNWEYAVNRWALSNGYGGGGTVFVPNPNYVPPASAPQYVDPSIYIPF